MPPPEDKPPSAPNVEALTLAAVLESAAAGIVVTDQHGKITRANPAAHRLFGYAPGELLGHPVENLMPNPHRRRHADYMNSYMTTGHSRIIGIGRELPAVRKDGTIFPMHLSVGEYVVDGRPCFTGIVIDLSAQRDAEDQSRQKEALFRSVFESQTDAIIITDNENVIELTNPAFEKVFARPGSEVVGQPMDALYENAEEWRAYLAAGDSGAANEDPQTRVMHFRRGDEEVFSGVLVRAAIRDRTSAELGFVVAIRDITDELRREAQMMQSQRMEAIGQLTGGIAHDFNNLLTVILGNLELLEPRLDGELEASLASEAIEAAEMGARLTDRLLTFGRRQHFDTQQINLNEFVLNMIDILRRAIGEDIDLSTALEGSLWLTEADPGQVENAILNLAINARDAMSSGGRVVIETRNVRLDGDAVASIPELAPGAYVALAVSDTGEGMSEEIRARAFEPFFSTKEKGKGSGLGLATIYGFAKQSGGHASIYSEIGRGTVVTIYLPRAGDAPDHETEDEAEQFLAFGRGETILVVEDDDRVRRLTAKRLMDLGYRVIEAETGAVALDKLGSGIQVDLVFTDIVMPGGISGLDLQSRIAIEYPAIKVLLTSGYAEEFVNKLTTSDDAFWLLRKPYRQAELGKKIRAVLDS